MANQFKTLKPRIATHKASRLQTIEGTGWRAGKTSTSRGYGYQWQKAREQWLKEHPLCVMCEDETPPRTTMATVVDHKIPHQGNEKLFWDQKNWQSLCASHHSGDKARQEREMRTGQ